MGCGEPQHRRLAPLPLLRSARALALDRRVQISQNEQHALAQYITTPGIVEQVVNATRADDLIGHAARRPVYSEEELRDWRVPDA
jgi:hypothetical protein